MAEQDPQNKTYKQQLQELNQVLSDFIGHKLSEYQESEIKDAALNEEGMQVLLKRRDIQDLIARINGNDEKINANLKSDAFGPIVRMLLNAGVV